MQQLLWVLSLHAQIVNNECREISSSAQGVLSFLLQSVTCLGWIFFNLFLQHSRIDQVLVHTHLLIHFA